MRWSIAITTLAVGMAAIWPIFEVLCITAILCGGAVGAATIALQRHGGRVATNAAELREAFSWISFAPAMSNFLGPFSAGLLIDVLGYQAAFAFLASMPVLAWWFVRKVQEPVRAEKVHPGKSLPAWDLLKSPRFRWVLILGWFMNASWDLHGFLVPVLGHERGLSASIIGSVVGAFAFGAAAVRLLMPIYAKKLKEWIVITASTAVAGLVILAYPLLPAPIHMGALSLVLGVALGLVQPMVMAMLHQVVPEHRQGEALAIRMMLVNVSGVGVPLLLGAIGSAAGAAVGFWLVGGVVSGGSLLGLKLPRHTDHHVIRVD